MRWLYLLLLALPAAAGGAWGVWDTLQKHPRPLSEGGAPLEFYGYLALALAGILVPGVAYLNRRFLPDAAFRHYRWRPFRQAAWIGLCVASWMWLLEHREFRFPYAMLIALIFVALELLCQRLFRGKP